MLLLTFYIVNFLADKYLEGENTYVIDEDDKLTNVIVTRIKYNLSMEALEKFKAVHDEWELKVCEKVPFNSLIGGNSIFKNHVTCTLTAYNFTNCQ